jgi:hypothetical protein
MKAGKRFWGAIALVLATVGIISCAGAVVVVWSFNPPLIRAAASGIEGFARLVSAGRAVVDGVDATVTMIGHHLDQVETEAARMGDAAGDRETVQHLAQLLADEAVQDRLETAGDNLENLRSIIGSFQALIDGSFINALALVPPDLDQKMERFEHMLVQIQAETAALAAMADEAAVSEIRPLAAAILARTGSAKAIVKSVRPSVEEIQGTMADADGRLARLGSRIPTYIHLGSVLLSGLFVWMILAQGCLFRCSYRWLTQAAVSGYRGSRRL